MTTNTKITILLLGFFIVACTNVKDLRVEAPPAYTAQTYWLSQQYTADNNGSDLSATYITRLIETTPTHYHLAVSLKDQPQVAYTIKVRRVDLAIDGFIASGDKTLDIYMPLLSFPLFKGKVWTATVRLQEHPRRPVQEVPVTMEVKEITNYNYLPNKKIPGEKQAFRIEMTTPNQTLSYYYIAPDKKFPGTNPVDLYLQLNLIHANAPQIVSEVLEYVR